MARLVFNKTALQLSRDAIIAPQIFPQPFKILLTILLTITIANMASADTRCENPAATLESAKGVVEWTIGDADTWQKAERGGSFCYGDKIRVLEQRAALRLANETLVRLQENSLITLLPEEKGFWFGLLEGAGHFLSRTPKQFTIKAPYLNAAVDGTEFVVIAQPQENRVAVVEGAVRVSNDLGEVRLSEGTQTSATANSRPSAIQSIRLRDAADWVLYYPPLIVQISAPAQIETLIQQENYAEALAQLTTAELTPETTALAASLAYHIGNTNQGEELLAQTLNKSPDQAEALALQALRTLIGGDSEAALAQTTQLINAHPQNPSALLAHAYAQQSHGKIEEALKTNLQAQALIPDNLFVLARTAELQLSLGNTRAAQKLINKALTQAPQHSRLNTLAGFIALNRFATSKAQNHFQAAITSNSNEPLARLGLALAFIQKGKINEGRAQMEMAVLLDPTSSLLRSYLGKTYATQNQNDWADTQYQLAKNLDPNDPTPWFYQSHLKHEENKPGEALRLITTAIEKNDNRAVYRSRMLLDSDAAARSANLAQIYQRLGLSDRARHIAATSLAENPVDFAPHRTLATTLANNRSIQSQVARLNEAHISRLLSPIGVKEFKPGFSSLSLLDPYWLTLTQKGAHENSSIFTTGKFGAEFTSTLGPNQTSNMEWQLQAMTKDLSFSGGQQTLESDGHRKNNDLYTKTTESTVHWKPIEKLKLFALSKRKEERAGDLLFKVDSLLFDESFRVSNIENTSQIGASVELSKNHFVLVSGDQSDISSQLDFQYSAASEDIFDIRANKKIKNFHIAMIGKYPSGTYQIGYHFENFHSDQNQVSPPNQIDPWADERSTSRRLYYHLYYNIYRNFQLFGGGSLSDQEWDLLYTNKHRRKDGYKLGLNWNITQDIEITAAHWTDLSPRLPRYGSVENSQIFRMVTTDYLSAFTSTETSSASISFSKEKLFINLSSEVRKVEPWAHVYLDSNPQIANITSFKFEEEKSEFSINYFLDHISLYYKSTVFNQYNKSRQRPFEIPIKINSLTNAAGASLSLPHRLVYTIHARNIDQDVEYEYFDYSDAHTSPSRGTILDMDLTYSFPEAKGFIMIQYLNATDRDISVFSRRLYEPTDPLSIAPASFIFDPPERSLFLTISVKL
jgi:Tfp pilus assembly protein PilF